MYKTRHYDNALESVDIWDAREKRMIFHCNYRWPKESNLPLCIYGFCDVTRNDNCWFKHINFPNLAVEMLLSGAMEYACDNKKDIVKKNEVRVLLPGNTTRMQLHGPEARRKLCLQASGNAIAAIIHSLGFIEDFTFIPPNPEEFEKKLRAIAEEREKNGPIAGSVKLYELLLEISHCINNSKQENKNEQNKIFEVLSLIEGNPANLPSVEDLAASMKMSYQTFYRVFKQHLKISPKDYILNYRLKYAAELLEQGCSVKETAVTCGFQSISQFIRMFTQRFKTTPGKYQINSRKI